MALTSRRYRFGGTSADVTQSVGDDNAAFFAPLQTLWVWDAATGGSRLTDLRDASDSTITEVVSTSTGQVPEFYGPAGQRPVYVGHASGGDRVLLAPSNLDEDIDELAVQVENVEVAAGIQTINSLAPDGAGDITLAPGDLTPSAAEASDLAPLEQMIGARVLQSGSGYPPKPAEAQWAWFLGSVDPGSAADDGDLWFREASS